MIDTFDDFLALEEDVGSSNVALLRATLFDKQIEFVDDPSKRKAMCCGRRAAKTDTICKMLLMSAEQHPGEDEWSGYATLTQGVSMRNIEGTLKKLIRKHRLPFVWKTVKNQIHLVHSNGHTIWIGGIDDLRKAERYRGNKWRLFVVDEAGTFPPAILRYLTIDVLKMALSDLGGTMVIAGTPGQEEKGFWWEISTGLGENHAAWPTYSWLASDNPFHPASKDPQAFYDSERLDLGWVKPDTDDEAVIQHSRDIFDANNATFRRECLGQWAQDTENLIYRYDMERNGFIQLPEREGTWRHVLGIDCGIRDATTFSITASCSGWPDIFGLESSGRPGMLPGEVASHIHQLKQRYPIDRIVIDPAGGGLGLIENLTRTYGIACYGADKRGKSAGIRLVQDGLRKGTVHVHPFHCAQLLGEWASLKWDKDRKDHNPAQEDDCSDGFIYSCKEHHIVEVFEVEPPRPGTREAVNAEAKGYEERLRIEQRIRTNTSLSPVARRRALRSIRSA
jgi:hypothetical protein